MKSSLIILIAFCTLINKVYSQSPSGAIDSLIKYGIITTQDRVPLENEVKYLKEKGKANYRIAILAGLENIMIQNKFHIDPHRMGSIFSYNKKHLSIKSQDSINTSLRALLEKIERANLLTERVYNYALKNIDSGTFVVELQLIGSLAEVSSRFESLAPNKVLPIAKQLYKNGILSDSSYLRLKNDINNEKIESGFQLNNYCEYDKILDMAKYPDDPNVWLEQLHHDIASILPGLNFTDFKYTEVPDTSFSIAGVRFKVSLTCNRRIYKHISVPIGNYRHSQGKVKPKDIFIEDFYRIFNKILTDQQSPFRIHSIMFNQTVGNDDIQRFGLIALKDSQAEVFMKQPCLSYMFISLESYDTTSTSAKIDSTIAGWNKIGLFAHLSNAQINKAIDDAQATDPFFTSSLLSNFPGVIYNLHEALNEQDYPYSYLLKHIAEITHGAFNPSKIVEKKAKKGVLLQYMSGGRIHSYNFSTNYGWLDSKFPSFLKDLGRENQLPGNFYQLLYDNSIIYLTKQQHDDAVNEKLMGLASIKWHTRL